MNDEDLRSIAAEDAAVVLEQARAGARERARKVLEDQLTQAILDAVASRPEATMPQPEGTGWWVYGLVAAHDAPDLSDVTGLEGATVELIPGGGLLAVASAVPLTEYGDERLREHLEDMAWVERTARAHEAVLEALLEATTPMPMRLCTIFASRERVVGMLADDGGRLRETVARLRGHREWGLKAFTRAQQEPDAGDPTDGTSYLQAKRRARDAREQQRQALHTCARDLHEALTAHAVDERSNPLQRRELHGRDADMLLNGAYLVERPAEPALHEVVESLRESYAERGVELELTGPWPPYHFVDDPAPAAR